METIADVACTLLGRGQPLVLAKIVLQSGSAPRAAGTQMAVAADGRMIGTIGGGLLEARAAAQSRELLEMGGSRWIAFDLSHDDVAAMDMICGGAVEVLLDHLRPEEETVSLFARWRQILARGEKGLLLTLYYEEEGGGGRTRHALALEDGSLIGSVGLPENVLLEAIRGSRTAPLLRTIALDRRRLVIEPAATPSPLFLFGAGHVAVPTARLAAMVGFRVEVVDDRAEFANRQRFPEADGVRVIADFAHALEGLPIDVRSGIVILTRGHHYDRTVLAQALRSPARYIGMIGSRRKRDAIYASLLAEGFSAADLERVHSPIGLAIAADTPEEIAVSIVAELIQDRARKRP